MKNLLQTILVSILVILVFSLFIIAISIPKPYPISEPCPDDPEGWTDKNGVYHYDSIHQAKWDKWH